MGVFKAKNAFNYYGKVVHNYILNNQKALTKDIHLRIGNPKMLLKTSLYSLKDGICKYRTGSPAYFFSSISRAMSPTTMYF